MKLRWLRRLVRRRPAGRWREFRLGTEPPATSGVVMLAAPRVFWINASADMGAEVRAAILAPSAETADALRARTVWIWWHPCSEATAQRWSRYLRERIRPMPVGPPSEVELIH